MRANLQRYVLIIVAGSLYLSVAAVSANTYRWKDKDGETHYGSAVPAEYADQPYDVINNAGLVIEHVKVTREQKPVEIKEEQVAKQRAPLISDAERQRQSDRLLLIQYQSEQDIKDALKLEITQLGYDSKIIHQSLDSTAAAIRDQIRLAADQQRAGKQINAKQQKQIDKLYRRIARDKDRISALDQRKSKIRARFESYLDRYRRLQNAEQAAASKQVGQG